MSGEWIDHPGAREWADHVRDELIPKLRDSAMTVSLIPTDPTRTDIKFAVELGLSIMLDKPIIIVARPGTQVPDHLVRVADAIVDGVDGPLIRAAIDRVRGGVS